MSSWNYLRNLFLCKSFRTQSKLSSEYFSGFFSWQKKRNLGRYNVVFPGNVAEQQRLVPDHIPKPPYFSTGFPPPLSFSIPEIKNEFEIGGMRHACQIARQVLEGVGQEVKIGTTTDDLDAVAHKLIIDANAYPSPLHYKGFPKSVCTSVNNVCCHGIPDDRRLEDGDIVNIDVTVYFEGFHGDCSKTFCVGNVDDNARKLIEVTELCLRNAIAECRPNIPFSVIGNVIEETARSNGLYVLPAVLGHGIGSYFHGPPEVWHISNSNEELMRPGNTFTIEPALTHGGVDLEVLEDGWTVVTCDHARTAQCEHTVLITDTGVEILTLLKSST